MPAGAGAIETDEQRFGLSVLAQSYSPHDFVVPGEVLSVRDELQPLDTRGRCRGADRADQHPCPADRR